MITKGTTPYLMLSYSIDYTDHDMNRNYHIDSPLFANTFNHCFHSLVISICCV